MSSTRTLFSVIVPALLFAMLVATTGCDKLKPSTAAKTGDPSKAMDDYDKALLLAEAHQYKKAIPALKKVLEEEPDDKRAGSATYYLALSYQETDDSQNAIATYTAFIKKFPKHEKAQSARNNLAKKFGVTL